MITKRILRQREVRAKNKLEGICTSCGCKPARIGSQCCVSCLDTRTQYYRRKRDEAYDIIFSRYGKTCKCCGEKNIEFLTLDHINGGGNKHRKELKSTGGVGFYHKLIKLGLPEGFQTLCFNCNLASHHNGGVCPHQSGENNVQDAF
jgi:hypothetical protein